MTTPTLDRILEEVRAAALLRAQGTSEKQLREAASAWSRRSMRESLERPRFAVIAEIKRASPSAGPLRTDLQPVRLAQQYVGAGARAISVLTCGPYFQGSLQDLRAVREVCPVPVLCKDFLVTPFQVLEAAAAGADAVLLIAAALDDKQMTDLKDLASSFQMEILFEAHSASEIDRILAFEPRLLGVNSRDLKTMQMQPEVALGFGAKIPSHVLAVFESGIKTAQDLANARVHGYRAALVGESLLKSPDPALHLTRLLQSVPSG